MNLRRELGGCTTPASQRHELSSPKTAPVRRYSWSRLFWPGISHPWQRPPRREPVSCQGRVCRAPHPNPVGPGALPLWRSGPTSSWSQSNRGDPKSRSGILRLHLLAKEQFRLRVPSGVLAVQDDALAKERRGATGRCRSERRWVAAMRRSIAARWPFLHKHAPCQAPGSGAFLET